MKKIGVVGIPGGWSSEKLVDTIHEKTGFRLLIDMNEVVLDLNRETVFYRDTDLLELDAIIIKKIGQNYSPDLLDRLTILRYLSHKGLPFFSKPHYIARILNRLDCTMELKRCGMPIPETVITEDRAAALQAVQKFGKAVLKPLYTSKAKGMCVVEAGPQLPHHIDQFLEQGNTMIYIQKYINIPGKDLGLSFLGGRYIGTYARVMQEGAWNTTTKSGGRYESYKPDWEIIELAQKAQDPFGLDFTCVDVVETEEGPKIFEVSAFGGFKGLWQACQIDAANLYAEYVLERLAESC
jgi:tetrahydromethanopterin:alpha-L-glutamate ligase